MQSNSIKNKNKIENIRNLEKELKNLFLLFGMINYGFLKKCFPSGIAAQAFYYLEQKAEKIIYEIRKQRKRK